MTAKIINIESARVRAHQQFTTSRGPSPSPDTSYDYESFFTLEYEKLIREQHTRSCKYKHPTVLSDYKKDINPIDALYQNLQESLFKYDPNNEFCSWIVDLFKNEEWLEGLIQDIENDCSAITEFQRTHIGNVELDKLHILQNIKSNFQHYIEVFMLMKDWKN